ncbi:MAG: signal peptidase I [Verrucomicrobiota bacterium]
MSKRPKTRLFVIVALILGPFLGVWVAFQMGWLVIFKMAPIDAMRPTIKPGDLVLVETISYRFISPKQGDLLVFLSTGISYLEDRHYDELNLPYLQRVVAVPGDEIRIENTTLWVGDNPWEPIDYGIPVRPGAFLKENQTIVVPKDCFFVLADAHDISQDSREWGWVPRENIFGRILVSLN